MNLILIQELILGQWFVEEIYVYTQFEDLNLKDSGEFRFSSVIHHEKFYWYKNSNGTKSSISTKVLVFEILIEKIQ